MVIRREGICSKLAEIKLITRTKRSLLFWKLIGDTSLQYPVLQISHIHRFTDRAAHCYHFSRMAKTIEKALYMPYSCSAMRH